MVARRAVCTPCAFIAPPSAALGDENIGSRTRAGAGAVAAGHGGLLPAARINLAHGGQHILACCRAIE